MAGPMPVLLPVSLPCCEPTTFYNSDLLSKKEQKDSENPCCQPTTFYAVYCPTELKFLGTFGARFIPLLRSYTVLWRFNASIAKLMRERKERETLAASLRCFMPVTTPPCGAVGVVGTPVSRLYTLTLESG
jgi:hypothetical protein